MSSPQPQRTTLPSGDVVGVLALPVWSPCLVVVDLSGSLGSTGTELALAAANQILAELPPRRQACAIAYAHVATLSGLCSRAPRPSLSWGVLDQLGLRMGREQAAWELARLELLRHSGAEPEAQLTAEIVWISDFVSGQSQGPRVTNVQGSVHRLSVPGRESGATAESEFALGPQGEVPQALLDALQPDPGDLRVSLDHPGRWFVWEDGVVSPGPSGQSASLAPASGSLAWISLPQAKARVGAEGAEVDVEFADGSPDPDLLRAVGEVIA